LVITRALHSGDSRSTDASPSIPQVRLVHVLLVVGFLFALLACRDSFLSERVIPPGAQARVTSVTVTPDTATILLQGTLPLVATLSDSAGNVVTGDTVLWSVRGTVGNPTGIRASAVSPAGVLTAGLYQDSLIVTADARGGIRGTAVIRVRYGRAYRVIVRPDSTWLPLGSEVPLVAFVRDSLGNGLPFHLVSWTSSEEGVATVAPIGLGTDQIGRVQATVTARATGTATITAAAGDVISSAAIIAETVQFSGLSAGDVRACGIASTGWMYCWGDNYGPGGSDPDSVGTLGAGIPYPGLASTAGLDNPPVRVRTTTLFSSLARATGAAACALTSSGAVYCWGAFYGGPRPYPTRVASGYSFADFEVARGHLCGVSITGAAYCWGSNTYGALGIGTPSDASTPTSVAGGLSFASVSTAGAHSCGVTTNGEGYCWGSNALGLLGTGDTTVHMSLVPAAVTGGLMFRVISVGESQVCGLTTAGSAYCWGWNQYGQLGASSPEYCVDSSGFEPCSDHPIAVSGGISFQAITSGNAHVCGLASNGVAYCWGLNDSGALGDGSTANRNAPTPVTGGYVFGSLTAGGSFTCGTTTDSTVFCWGAGTGDELGVPRTFQSSVPVRVVGQP
jgi:alpha-tubulin suppressor-like RCC1 family protein